MNVCISHPVGPSRSLCVVVEVVFLYIFDARVAVVADGHSHEVDLAQDML